MTPPSTRPHPDAKLAAALARDLDASFERVVTTYQDRLFRFATRFLGNPLDGQEVAQDAFVRAYRALQTFDRSRIRGLAVGPWLYQIVLNTAKNRVRGKRVETTALEAARDRAIDREEEPERRALARSTSDLLATQIARLPARFRAPLILRYIEDLPYAEIAAALESPLGTVKANVHRGLALLRDRISETEGVLS